MKKRIFRYFGLMTILMALLTSCSEETEGPLYDTEGHDYASFFRSTQIASVQASDENVVQVPVYRFDKSKTGTTVAVNVEFLDGSGEYISLSSPSEVTFEKGENAAYFDFSFDKEELEFMVDYQVKLTIDEENSTALLSPLSTAVGALTLTIQRALTFQSAGTGTFISDFNEDEWDQAVLLANEAVIYRLPNLYGNGFNIDIVMDGNSATISSQPGWLYDATYGNVFVRGTGVLEDGVLKMELEHHLPLISYSFGVYSEQLVMPE